MGRRFWGEGDASENGMPAKSLRKHSPPDNMARHRTLQRAMASTSEKNRTVLERNKSRQDSRVNRPSKRDRILDLMDHHKENPHKDRPVAPDTIRPSSRHLHRRRRHCAP